MALLARFFSAPPGPNPLVGPVRPFNRRGKLALRHVATTTALHVATWSGCPLNRAGELLGADVHDATSAAEAFGVSQDDVFAFIHAWDMTRGPRQARTALLVDALDIGLIGDAVDEALQPGAVLRMPAQTSAAAAQSVCSGAARSPDCARGRR